MGEWVTLLSIRWIDRHLAAGMVKCFIMKRRDKFHPVDGEGNYLSGPALYEICREIGGDALLLAFSRGKDSICAWLELREYFNIIPYYCYIVPGGLSYECESLDYYEDYFSRRIARFVHPIFWKNINDFVFQPPQRVRVIRTLDYPHHEQADIARLFGESLGLSGFYTAFGYRSADDIRRRILVEREGPLGLNAFRYFWPIWDWNKQRVTDTLIEHDVALPIDYEFWGRTNTALDYEYSSILRDTLPDDFDKLCFWYPLLEAEMFRHEQVGHVQN